MLSCMPVSTQVRSTLDATQQQTIDQLHNVRTALTEIADAQAAARAAEERQRQEDVQMHYDNTWGRNPPPEQKTRLDSLTSPRHGE